MLFRSEQEVAQLIVESLNLTIAPEDMEPNILLFNEGLGLDSIDALELSLAISQRYGISIRSDDKNINQYFSSLRALSEYIHEKKSSGDVEKKQNSANSNHGLSHPDSRCHWTK